jgi:hypothetical protein
VTGKKSQRKGRTFELEVPRIFEKYGVECWTHGQYETLDATAKVAGEDWPIECKREAKCNGRAYRTLQTGAKLLIEQADRCQPIVTMWLSDFLLLASDRPRIEITEEGQSAIDWIIANQDKFKDGTHD